MNLKKVAFFSSKRHFSSALNSSLSECLSHASPDFKSQSVKACQANTQNYSINYLCSEINQKIKQQVAFVQNTLSDKIILKAFLIYLKRLDQINLYNSIKHSNCTFRQLRGMNIDNLFPFKNDLDKKTFFKGLSFMAELEDTFYREKLRKGMGEKKKIEELIDESCVSQNDEIDKLDLFSNKPIVSTESLNKFISQRKSDQETVIAVDFAHRTTKKSKLQGSYAYCQFSSQLNDKIQFGLLKSTETNSVNDYMINALMKIFRATESSKSKPLYIILKSDGLFNLLKRIVSQQPNDKFDVDKGVLKLMLVTLQYRNIQFIKSAKQLKIFEDLQKAASQFK